MPETTSGKIVQEWRKRNPNVKTSTPVQYQFARWAKRTYGFDFRMPGSWTWTFRKAYARNIRNVRAIRLGSAAGGIVKATIYNRKDNSVIEKIEMPLEKLMFTDWGKW